MKTCTKCQIEKSLDEFGLNRPSPDGRATYCKTCKREYQKAYYASNTDRYRRYAKNWRTTNKTYKAQVDAAYAKAHPDRVAKAKAKYRESHREQLRAASKEYGARTKEAKAKYSAEYRIRNLDKIALKEARRRTRKAGNGVFVILPKELRKLKTQPCIYCGGKAEHMDHITPISRGGRHSIGNLAPACAKCNLSKRDKFVVEWKVGAF